MEWWGDAEVPLFNVLTHLLAETSRHAGHADILREGLDGAVGTDAEAMAADGHDAAFWAATRRDRGRRTCGSGGLTEGRSRPGATHSTTARVSMATTPAKSSAPSSAPARSGRR